MKNIYKHFSFLIISVLFSVISFAQTYAPGIIITNEGGFMAGNASLSHLSEEGEITNDIFSTANPGESLGDTAQGMNFFGDYAYIVMHGSETVKVVNRESFELVTTIEGFSKPRHIAFSNGKGYVTNWADEYDPEDDFVAVVNLETYEIEAEIPVAEGPERIIEVDGKLYVTQQGGYGYGNAISVIDAETNEVTEIEVGDVPSDLLAKDGFLYVTCGGSPLWSGAETAGSLYKIDLSDNSIVSQFDFESVEQHPNYLGENGDLLYFVMNNGIYTINFDDETPSPTLLVETEVAQPYSFDVIDDKLYIGDAVDYVSNGIISVYALDGTLENTYTVGVLPNGFYKNEIEEMSVIDDSLAKLNLYPNPASNVFYVNSQEVSQVEIYDLSGKLVKSTQNISNGISVNELSNGIYIVKIQSGKNSISKKLIIK